MNCVMRSIYIVVLFEFVLQYSHAGNIRINDCGSKYGKVNELSISGCSDSEKRCVLKRNTNVTIVIGFQAEMDTDELKVVVHGIILDVPTPFPMPQPDACKDSGIVCPIQKGNSYEYSTNMPILKTYPKIALEIKFELKSSEDYVCVIIPARLQ